MKTMVWTCRFTKNKTAFFSFAFSSPHRNSRTEKWLYFKSVYVYLFMVNLVSTVGANFD